MRSCTLILFLLSNVAPAAEPGPDREFRSGPQRTHLIELFTSEGCSSCPVAEAWLSKLKGETGLWREFVPMAFHVDYWDRLGWRDPFASKEWTARQYRYAARWNTGDVYTPCLVVDGCESPNRTLPPPATDAPGTLKVSIANGMVAAEFHPATSASGDFNFFFVALACDNETKVTSGENSGRNLREDFIVLSLASEKLVKGKAELPFQTDPRARAIAGWITAPDKTEPVQAVGGWLR